MKLERYDMGCSLISQQGVVFIAGVLCEMGKFPGGLPGEQREGDALFEMGKERVDERV